MRKNKYKPEEWVFADMLELSYWLEKDSWIYLYGRPKHPAFIKSMRYQTLEGFISKGILRLAILNEEE